MKTKTIFQKTAVILAMFVFIVFAFSACSTDDDSDDNPDTTTLKITKVKVIEWQNSRTYTDIPLVGWQGVGQWDNIGANVRADIYPEIKDDQGTTLWSVESEYVSNAVPGEQHSWEVEPNLTVLAGTNYKFKLLDNDPHPEPSEEIDLDDFVTPSKGEKPVTVTYNNGQPYPYDLEYQVYYSYE